MVRSHFGSRAARAALVLSLCLCCRMATVAAAGAAGGEVCDGRSIPSRLAGPCSRRRGRWLAGRCGLLGRLFSEGRITAQEAARRIDAYFHSATSVPEAVGCNGKLWLQARARALDQTDSLFYHLRHNQLVARPLPRARLAAYLASKDDLISASEKKLAEAAHAKTVACRHNFVGAQADAAAGPASVPSQVPGRAISCDVDTDEFCSCLGSDGEEADTDQAVFDTSALGLVSRPKVFNLAGPDSEGSHVKAKKTADAENKAAEEQVFAAAAEENDKTKFKEVARRLDEKALCEDLGTKSAPTPTVDAACSCRAPLRWPRRRPGAKEFLYESFSPSDFLKALVASDSRAKLADEWRARMLERGCAQNFVADFIEQGLQAYLDPVALEFYGIQAAI